MQTVQRAAVASRGIFITVEGVDGAGKSTHLDWLTQTLRARVSELVVTREPGGTTLGERLRELLLSTPMALDTEALLMFAARAEHISQVIEPALARGAWVLCDRFTDATFAYQGAGRQLGTQRIEALQEWTHPQLQPDLTFLFDLSPQVAAQRRQARQTQTSTDADRFEQESAAFFERTRNAYLERAAQDPQRFAVIDSSKTLSEVAAQVAAALEVAMQRFTNPVPQTEQDESHLLIRRIPHRSGQ